LCPVEINTGDLTKVLRADKNQKHMALGALVSDHYGSLLKVAGLGMAAANLTKSVIGEGAFKGSYRLLQKGTGGLMPPYFGDMYQSRKRFKTQDQDKAQDQVIYFPSCVSRTLGGYSNNKNEDLGQVTETLLKKAGFSVLYPPSLEDLCCGMPFESKGLFDLRDQKIEAVTKALEIISDQGRIPIYMDTSPCSLTLKNNLSKRFKVYDSVEFIAEYILPRLTLTPLEETVMVHGTCSGTRMNVNEALLKVTKACAARVVVPEGIGCCGFAGDKGFTMPELNEAALSGLKAQIPSGCGRGVSTSRTCELGLSSHSGLSYRSLAHLVLAASEATP
jgi:D-lactate dehydrogenase